MYIKLKAQRLLIGQNSKAFFVSILPFFMTSTLSLINYYLLFYLKNNNEIKTILKIIIAFCSVLFSLLVVNAVSFVRENFFYRKVTNSFSPVNAADVFCSLGVNILKFLLLFSWLAVFLTPSAVLLYSANLVKYDNYPSEVFVVLLASSAVTCAVGLGCLFTVFGRYSKTYFVQMKTGETNPLKVLAKSIELSEGDMIKFALFRLSFLGWDILSLLLIPLVYVLPYRKCAKYVFFTEKKKTKFAIPLNEKPIVFIFG